ncbi:MAG: helix-turn-helix transcriptional regulator [Campylobacteraceae bacterium]|nr:helix-turn-helix transcriptional regulator [Campylobacteraceae bacterium]
MYDNKNLLFVGSFNESIIIPLKANSETFGIRFMPSVLPQLLNIKASEFTNKIIPLEDISKELFLLLNFNEKVETTKVNKLNNILENYCEDIILNKNMLRIIDEIMFKEGNLSIKEISQTYDINSRQLERLFNNLLGFSPKKFTNIIRFFYAFKSLMKNGFNELSLKALGFGYYDQAHFNKEFKKFSNFTPTDEVMSFFYNIKK